MPAPSPHSKRAKCRTYLEKEKYRSMPRKALARIIYGENNLLFKDVEAVRKVLREVAGKAGAGHRDRLKGKEVTKFYETEDRPKNPYKLPESDETSYEPYILKGHKKLAIFSDIHLPYHSVQALSAALSHCKKEKVDALLLNGDTLDCHQLSRFERDPRKKNFAQELEVFKQMVEAFKKTLKCKIYIKLGNHSERYEHFLMTKAHELVGVEEFEISNIIKSRVSDVEVIKDKRIIHANKLSIIHGHEFGQGFFSPVNVARGLSLRAKTSAIQGHNHQVSEHTSVDLNGKVMTTWSTGCLCELSPRFLPINNWQHGFAIVELSDNEKDFHVKNFRIDRGTLL